MNAETDSQSLRLATLRQLMVKVGFDGWIVGREDMYQGEEVPAGEERLAYISGFTGSAGFAVILGKTAGLFSDGRYSLQMETQTSQSDWQCNTISDMTFENWLKAKQLAEGFTIGIDAWLVTKSGFERFEGAVLAAGGKLLSHSENLVDAFWQDRPPMPSAKTWQMPYEFSGKTVAKKLDDLATQLQDNDCEAVLITRVDSVNWLVNMRGADLPCTPITLCFALFHPQTGLHILLDEMESCPMLSKVLGDCVMVSPLASLPSLLERIGQGNVMVDPASLPKMLFEQILVSPVKIVQATCLISTTKACKNEAELQGFRAAQRRDGVAMVEFLCWLDHAMQMPDTGFFESEIATRLLAFRQRQEGFISPSFNTIAGSGPNGAIVHYQAIAGADRQLLADDMLLLDSGAHYFDGTTDITRTIATGTPPNRAVTAFTHVLRAHICLAQANFPYGTTGQQLDAITRAPLWAANMDFAHGTGHGVGHLLSVHEGPASISKRGTIALEAGMVLSNEPAYYQNGEWGIRIENLVVVGAANNAGFLHLETITLCPFDRRLIDKALLNADEISWVDQYHCTVKAELLHHLSDAAKLWLRNACHPL
ncbi:M24 family metallopeptidase [Candidatus Puniceispirillum sp.]|nr:M24 family metallopeptidase [Candidatus Puniceispirillum sp.]